MPEDPDDRTPEVCHHCRRPASLYCDSCDLLLCDDCAVEWTEEKDSRYCLECEIQSIAQDGHATMAARLRRLILAEIESRRLSCKS